MISSSLGLSDVRHLNSLFSEFPLIPTVIGIDILFNEVGWSLYTFVKHKFILDATLYCLIDETKLDLNDDEHTFLKVSSSLKK